MQPIPAPQPLSLGWIMSVQKQVLIGDPWVSRLLGRQGRQDDELSQERRQTLMGVLLWSGVWGFRATLKISRPRLSSERGFQFLGGPSEGDRSQVRCHGTERRETNPAGAPELRVRVPIPTVTSPVREGKELPT